MRPLAILPALASLTEFLCMPSGPLHTPPSHLHQGGCTLPSHPSAISICLPHVLTTTLHSLTVLTVPSVRWSVCRLHCPVVLWPWSLASLASSSWKVWHKRGSEETSLDKYILFCAGFGAMCLVILHFSWTRKLRLQRLSHCSGSAQVCGPEPTSLHCAMWCHPATPAAHLCLISPQSTQKKVNLTSARKNATRSRWNVCCYSGVWVLLWTPEQQM